MLELHHAAPAFRIVCGSDAVSQLATQLDRAGVRRAVVFCGQSMARTHTAVLARVEDILGDRLVARFDHVEARSPLPSVEAGRDLLSQVGADAVVAIGGGSAIVSARAASILLAESKSVRELCTRREADGRMVSPRLLAPKLRQWVVPTTPTTAYAKVGSAVHDPETGERLALFDPKTGPQAIFIDPAMVMTAPPAIVHGAALNALSMCVEGLQLGVDDPIADALLIHAVSLLTTWIPQFLKMPDDPEPRVRLALASLLAGQGSNFVPAGLAQALSHAVGPRSTTSNGMAEAVLVPHAMRFNADACAERQQEIADLLLTCAGDSLGNADDRITIVGNLLATFGAPSRLRDIGIAKESLPQVAEHTLGDWSVTTVPRPVTREDLEELLRTAW